MLPGSTDGGTSSAPVNSFNVSSVPADEMMSCASTVSPLSSTREVARPREAFQKDTAKHDRVLCEVHVVGRCAAVKQERAHQHLDQQRVLQKVAQHGPGGQLTGGETRDLEVRN